HFIASVPHRPCVPDFVRVHELQSRAQRVAIEICTSGRLRARVDRIVSLIVASWNVDPGFKGAGHDLNPLCSIVSPGYPRRTSSWTAALYFAHRRPATTKGRDHAKLGTPRRHHL